MTETMAPPARRPGEYPFRPQEAVYAQAKTEEGVWWRMGWTTGDEARHCLVGAVLSGGYWLATRWGDAPAESLRHESPHLAARALVPDAEDGRAPHRLTADEARAKAAAQGRPYPTARAKGRP